MANAVSETVISVEPVEAPTVRPPAWRRWAKRVLLLLILIWVAEHGLTLVIRHTPLQRRITARLESAFGRPVEVAILLVVAEKYEYCVHTKDRPPRGAERPGTRTTVEAGSTTG